MDALRHIVEWKNPLCEQLAPEFLREGTVSRGRKAFKPLIHHSWDLDTEGLRPPKSASQPQRGAMGTRPWSRGHRKGTM